MEANTTSYWAPMCVRNIDASRKQRSSREPRRAALEPPVANIRSTACQASLPHWASTSRIAPSSAVVNGSPRSAKPTHLSAKRAIAPKKASSAVSTRLYASPYHRW